MKKTIVFLLGLLVVLATIVWIRHGGGNHYPNLTDAPLLSEDSLEEVLSYPEPIGNVAVSSDGRVFFTVHPEARPKGNRLLEYVDGASVPYPSRLDQAELFDTPLGIAIDRFDRLWVVDHGNHGLRNAQIVAVDLETGDVIRKQTFDKSVAPPGSLLQDLQISADGKTIVIADASFWRKRPALVIYDVESGSARRVLENHASVQAENYLIRTPGKDMEFLGGMVALRGGVDGIALGSEWLYYGALNGSGLYRIRLSHLRNRELPLTQLAAMVERYSDKPLSDGLSLDKAGGVYITDIEHNAIFRADSDGSLSTLIRSRSIRWPDALSFGPEGYLYVADSALSDLILESDEHIESQAPYKIFRFKPGFEGIPGQ